MTETEAINELHLLQEGDPESAHGRADGILIEFLESSGYPELADAYEDARSRIGFWYA